ncbi:beta-lactamase/transpeptidase-like protein [Xylariales sp. AK1849]|nr:beta-lactamase/transpeptidase-like protein [Xylariales sp. AK1849]
MMWVKSLVLAVAGAASLSAAVNPCPLDGPVFPKPAKLSQLPIIKQAVANLTTQFQAWDADVTPTGTTANFSYSIQIFSAHEEDALFSYSHTASKLAKLKHPGVTQVDEDSVFRLGSLTKVFTVYAFLLNAGDKMWNEPITTYIPELAALANRSSEDPVIYTDWNDVTIGSLMTQMSGIPRDYSLLGELTQMPETEAHILQYGFPPLPKSVLPPCGDYPLCNRQQFFQGIAKFYPSVGVMQTPTYSDVGFQLLGYALEEITGKSFQSVLQDTVLTPLNLTRTFYTRPADSLGIIPGNANATHWNFQLGDESPAGNMYSSAKDISAFGRAILSYAQLSPVITRRWLKPFSFSSDPRASVGAPWGARRIPLGPEYRETTGYNKAGGIGDYQAAFVLIPDYDIGFSIMVAGDIPSNTNWDLADMLGGVFIPSVNAAAKNLAASQYNGYYAVINSTNGTPLNSSWTNSTGGTPLNSRWTNSTGATSLNPPWTNSTSGAPLNSSLTISTDDKPGLSVSQWFSNGTDFRAVAVSLQVEYPPVEPSIRLYPTGLEAATAGGGKKVAFKAIFEDLSVPQQINKMFSTDCGSWVGVESIIYATMSLDEFIFHFDAGGAVTGVESPALRIMLPKQS